MCSRNHGAVSLLQAEGEDGDKEWKGWRLLTMAGIFDCWEPPAGGEALYTYTIITVDASKDLSFIHHRQVRRTAGPGAAFKHPSANVGQEPCLLLMPSGDKHYNITGLSQVSASCPFRKSPPQHPGEEQLESSCSRAAQDPLISPFASPPGQCMHALPRASHR